MLHSAHTLAPVADPAPGRNKRNTVTPDGREWEGVAGMPNFQVFSREVARSREEPMFTLQARGLLSLNSAVFRALGEPEAVELLYDANLRIIGLRKVAK